jgi:hypothetical protein
LYGAEFDANNLFRINRLRGPVPFYWSSGVAFLWAALAEMVETERVGQAVTVSRAKAAIFFESAGRKTVTEDSRSVIRFLDRKT